MRLLLLCVVVAGLGFNVPLGPGDTPLYTGHVLAGLFLVVVLVAAFARAAHGRFESCPGLLVTCALIVLAGMMGLPNPRFVFDFAKLVTLLGSMYGFALVLVNWTPPLALLAAGVLAGVSLSMLTLVGPGAVFSALDTLSIESRLYVTSLGGSNVAALLMSIAIVSVLYLTRQALGSRWRWAVVVACIALVAFLGMMLIATLSRGGILALVVGVTAYVVLSPASARLLPGVLATAALLAVPLLGVIKESSGIVARYLFVQDLSGSGRTTVWALMLDQWAQNPIVALFGHGLGSIQFDFGDSTAVSGHSAYIDVLFQFGAVGLLLLLLWLVRLALAVASLPHTEDRAYIGALFSQIVMASAIDSYYGASQVGWLFGLLLALFYATSRPAAIEPYLPGLEPSTLGAPLGIRPKST